MFAYLVVDDSEKHGPVLLLDSEHPGKYWCGRHPDTAPLGPEDKLPDDRDRWLPIRRQGVSGQHASIYWDGVEWQISNQSRFGTRVMRGGVAKPLDVPNDGCLALLEGDVVTFRTGVSAKFTTTYPHPNGDTFTVRHSRPGLLSTVNGTAPNEETLRFSTPQWYGLTRLSRSLHDAAQGESGPAKLKLFALAKQSLADVSSADADKILISSTDTLNKDVGDLVAKHSRLRPHREQLLTACVSDVPQLIDFWNAREFTVNSARSSLDMRCPVAVVPVCTKTRREGSIIIFGDDLAVQDLDIACFAAYDLAVALSNSRASRRTMPTIVGSDPALVRTLQNARKFAAMKTLPVLTLGESGTGKELIAELVHYSSPRANGPLVKFNVAAQPAELFESELFGHVKGAFTGAIRDHAGKIEQANHGTLFLDEIGDLPLNLQMKLLRALEEEWIQRVGDEKTIPVNVRFITATNADLKQMVRDGEFREDLYYRIRGGVVRLPPLRERKDDIWELATHLAAKICNKEDLPLVSISEGAVNALKRRPWPGNIRQLGSELKRAIALSSEGGDISAVLIAGDADDEFADDEFADDEHTDDEHTDDEHTGDEHTGDEHTGDKHSRDKHSDAGIVTETLVFDSLHVDEGRAILDLQERENALKSCQGEVRPKEEAAKLIAGRSEGGHISLKLFSSRTEKWFETFPHLRLKFPVLNSAYPAKKKKTKPR